MAHSLTDQVCGRCALAAPTCCRLSRLREGGADCFPLSSPERARIAGAIVGAGGNLPLREAAAGSVDAATGAKGWVVEEANSPGFIKAMHNLFPGEKTSVKAVFPAGSGHMRLAFGPDGACAFLALHGCVLPRAARPWFCRIFPFWVARGEPQRFEAADCLAVREHGGRLAELLAAFGESCAGIEECYQKLRADWGMDIR